MGVRGPYGTTRRTQKNKKEWEGRQRNGGEYTIKTQVEEKMMTGKGTKKLNQRETIW